MRLRQGAPAEPRRAAAARATGERLKCPQCGRKNALLRARTGPHAVCRWCEHVVEHFDALMIERGYLSPDSPLETEDSDA